MIPPVNSRELFQAGAAEKAEIRSLSAASSRTIRVVQHPRYRLMPGRVS